MPFEHRPGQFTLFRNDNKSSEKSPDYRGEGKDLSGNPIEVAGWIKAGKVTFLSCQIKPKGEIQGQRIKKEPDSEIPF